MKLYVDDRRPAPQGWFRTRSAESAKRLLETGVVTHLSLDHDLSAPVFGGKTVSRPNAETGLDLVNWMTETGNWPSTTPKVHSGNVVGAEAMRTAIADFYPGPRKTTIKEIPGKHALALAKKLQSELSPFCSRVSIAGSLRRNRGLISQGKHFTVGDIDLVATPKPGVETREVLNHLTSLGKKRSSGATSATISLNGVGIDLDVVPAHQHESMLMTATGSKVENLKLRVIAKKQGLTLSEHGLLDPSGNVIASTERGIYQALGRPYKTPLERSTQRRKA